LGIEPGQPGFAIGGKGRVGGKFRVETRLQCRVAL
jgi:hypothetical protein